MNLKYKKLEKFVKGFANHRRIQILELLKKNPDLSVDQITQDLRVNFTTASEHLRKLSDAGLIKKRYQGRFVLNSLTKLGNNVLTFCKMLE